MRYSQVLGPAFYQIHLSREDRDLVDVHFTAAAHHYWRYREACGNGDAERLHLSRHRAHLRALMAIVFLRGDFWQAKDPSFRGLEQRASWNPDSVHVPDPAMFDEMVPDPRYAVGEGHSSDIYLKILEDLESQVTQESALDSLHELSRAS